MLNDPLETLMGRYRREILGTLLSCPGEGFHVRELQRLTGIPVGSLARELQLLADGGILDRRQNGNRVEYFVDRRCEVFKELTALFAASYGMPSPDKPDKPVIRRQLKFSQPALAHACRKHHVRRLSVFGSMARDDASPESDVDVLVEFEPDRTPGMSAMSRLKRQLSRVFQGRDVDVVTTSILENPYRRKTILEDMEVLYETRSKGCGIPVGHGAGVSGDRRVHQ